MKRGLARRGTLEFFYFLALAGWLSATVDGGDRCRAIGQSVWLTIALFTLRFFLINLALIAMDRIFFLKICDIIQHPSWLRLGAWFITFLIMALVVPIPRIGPKTGPNLFNTACLNIDDGYETVYPIIVAPVLSLITTTKQWVVIRFLEPIASSDQ